MIVSAMIGAAQSLYLVESRLSEKRANSAGTEQFHAED